MTRLPRWVHRSYAWVTRRFWLPCPVCGTPFGGHEVLGAEYNGGHIESVFSPNGNHPLICPDCTRRGEGCRSHAVHGRAHAQCPYLSGHSW